MFKTKPRRIASSAISRWLQWLIGRSLSDGLSQVIAITAQICSGVYVAGAPERGASASRSGTDWAGGACRQRPRQYRTVFGHTSSSRALSRTPTSSAACNIMRIRNANCCDVEWARSSASSASRCAGSTITGSAANRGIATSRLSFRLVMPHRRRFDSALCRKAASFRLPPYLHARRSRNFRSAVRVILLCIACPPILNTFDTFCAKRSIAGKLKTLIHSSRRVVRGFSALLLWLIHLALIEWPPMMPSGGPPRSSAACWSHGRRKLFDLAVLSKSPIAAEAVRRIDGLFEIERTVNRKTPIERVAVRPERAKPLAQGLDAPAT
jgi:hypothetical protein